MAYTPLPEEYRKSPPTLTTIDFFDAIIGVGYKRFYLLGTRDTVVGAFYVLTTDNLLTSDWTNYYKYGASSDLDFDITVSNGFTLAAEEAIGVCSCQADTAENVAVNFIVKHVAADTTETTLGTLDFAGYAGGAGAEYQLKTCKRIITRKRFNKGEKLRITVTTSAGTGANSGFYFDPAGLRVQTAESPNYPHTSSILLPIEADI